MKKMKKQKERLSNGKKRSGRWAIKGLIILAILGVAGSLLLLSARSDGPKGAKVDTKSASVRRETKPTLSPSLFVGKVAWAHEIAQEIPDVLDQLYCYCECDKHMGHKSLLSCYTDGHAAT